MRILHVIRSLAPHEGGPSVACPALCRELVRRGHQVSIYTTDVDGDRRRDVPLEAPVYDAGVETRYFRGWTHPRGYAASPGLWRALRERVDGFDLAHIYSVYGFSTTAAAAICHRHGVPYLVHPHGSLDPFIRRRHRARKWVYTALFARPSYRQAGAVLFNSREEMRLAADWLGIEWHGGNGRAAPRPAVVYVGVEDEWFHPPSREARERFRSRFPELRGRHLVVFFGRLNFKKGLDLLARAFAQLARERGDVHLVLAGPDREGYGERVREWLRQGGVLEKTTFTGPLAGEDRVAALSEAEIFALPSYTENFGQAVAEAMACGIPVVISDRVNIWPEVSDAGAGLVVPCDVGETARALGKLFGDRALGKQMGQRGRQLAEQKMTWQVVGEQMIEVYEQLMQSAPRRPGRARATASAEHTLTVGLCSSCKLCVNRRLETLYRSERHGFCVLRCSSCGLAFVQENPAEEQLREMYSDQAAFEEFAAAMDNEQVRARHRRALAELTRLLEPIPTIGCASRGPSLFDVGAGAGAFLKAAQDAGFEVYGNEYSSAAIRLARERYGFTLSDAPLEANPRTSFFDAVTMWGVLEHALDPRSLLLHAHRLLKPGGLLYLYTPVWCRYDDLGLALARAKRGATTRLLDRRITPAHLQLFTVAALERAVLEAGFAPLSFERVSEYNLPIAAYLESLGVPPLLRGGLGWAIDQMIAAGTFFRNNLRAFCRKPA